MRLLDLPSPGKFSGSATLRKDIVRAIDFAQRAYMRNSLDQTPEIVLTLENCFKHALYELSKLHKHQEAPEGSQEDDQGDSDTNIAKKKGGPPEGSQDDSKVSDYKIGEGEKAAKKAVSKNTQLPSILRKRKTK